VWVLHRLIGDRVTAALLSFAAALTYARSVGFSSTDGTFDADALVDLWAAIAVHQPVLVGGFVVLAGLIDERAVLAVPSVLLTHWLRAGTWRTPAVLGAMVGLVAYLGLRLVLAGATELHTGWGGVRLTLAARIRHVAARARGALEGLWLVVGVGDGGALPPAPPGRCDRHRGRPGRDPRAAMTVST
jgi:hypothetical protein